MKYSYSAGGIVVNNKGQVVVVNQMGYSWSLPKGHIEEREDPLDSAKREIFEETGISDLEYIKYLGSYQRHPGGKDGGENKDELKTITMFLFKANQPELKPQDSDNPEAKWVDKDKVVELLTYPKDKEFFESIINDL